MALFVLDRLRNAANALSPKSSASWSSAGQQKERLKKQVQRGQPMISVDTKKKELIGNHKNGGTDYRPKGDPWCVKVHDFGDKESGKVVWLVRRWRQCRVGERRDHK